MCVPISEGDALISSKHTYSPRFLRGSMAFDWDVPAPFFFLLPNMTQESCAYYPALCRSLPVCLPCVLSEAGGGSASVRGSAPAGGQCERLHGHCAPHSFILEEEN